MILEPKKIRSITASTFSPSICHEVMGLDAMILGFFNTGFQASFFTIVIHSHQEPLCFHFLLSAIRMISSVYLGLLIFLLVILIPAFDSSSLAFYMIFSA